MKALKRSVLIMLLTVVLIISSMTIFASNTEKERKIIVFKEGVTTQQKDEVLKKHGAEKIKNLDCINGLVVNVINSIKLREQREVLYIEDDFVISLSVKKPNTPPTPVPTPTEVIPWGIEYMGAPSQWNDSTDNVKVGVIDTGIDLDHPDLKANIKGSYNAISSKRSADDDNGHGTHVAGIIAACQNGIGVVGMVPNADLYAIKALDSTGNGYVSDIVEGIDWAITNDMDILNMSFGTVNDSQSLREVIVRANAVGIIMVAAAGNNYGGSCEYPATYPEVVSVGAVDKKGIVASFSAVDGVDVYAPGVGIYSTMIFGKYCEMDGTSMASPHWIGEVLNK